MRPVIPFVVAALLFGLGTYAVLTRRNAILLLMAVELMLNAVTIVLITADVTVRPSLPHSGAIFALFVIVLAAAEVGVGLAIVLQYYRLRQSVRVDEVPLDDAGDRDPDPPDGDTPGPGAPDPATPDRTSPDSGGPDSGQPDPDRAVSPGQRVGSGQPVEVS